MKSTLITGLLGGLMLCIACHTPSPVTSTPAPAPAEPILVIDPPPPPPPEIQIEVSPAEPPPPPVPPPPPALALDWLRLPARVTLPDPQDPRLVKWVDSVYQSMNDAQRIGQLIVLRAHSDQNAAYEQEVENQLRATYAGGLCFFQGTLLRQAELTNRYQQVANLPLFISMDAEYGLGMRLRDAITYPRQMTLGAIQNDELIYAYGREMARQCTRLGVHVSFSPSADVNNNPANPVINDRSFGEDVQNVRQKAVQYMRGLQDGGVMASAKHFPGHGDTDVDSHHALPILFKSREQLNALELAPFRTLIDAGIESVMVGHLHVPAFDARAKYPASLSRPIISEVLRNQLNFNQLVYTDAMEMKAVSDSFPSGQAALEALQAGCDIVLLPGNPVQAHATIFAALTAGTYDRAQMEASVRRVLTSKYRHGLHRAQRVELDHLVEDINTPAAYYLKRVLFEHAMTLLTNADWKERACLLPAPQGGSACIATLALGEPEANTVFQHTCSLFGAVDHFGTPKVLDSVAIERMLDTLAGYDEVLVSHHKTRSRLRDGYGLSPSQIQLVHQLNQRTLVRLTLFGNPYSARYFEQIPAIMVAYTEDSLAQESAAQAWFEANNVSGRLPVTASPSQPYGSGTSWGMRRAGFLTLKYGVLPEAVGMSSDTLRQIDALIQELINTGAAPGCQVLIAKNGHVIWHKAYGYYTYDQTRRVTTETMYDLASVTKVAATTISAMHLYDRSGFDPMNPLSAYVPQLKGTNKEFLQITDVLRHQAGLQAWIPFYEKTIDAQKRPLTQWYRSVQDTVFSVPVAPNLWMHRSYVDTMWRTIYRSDLRATRDYKYSDLTMYLTAQAIQNQSDMTLDAYASKHFYQPMGLRHTMYNPWRFGRTDDCAPTEQDDYFRQQRIQGYVHDMGAAMLGGVSGHAGLFSNANDVAKLFQMLLNGGQYGTKQYLQPTTVREWTMRGTSSTRRGLGFDMKELDPKAPQNMSPLAGPKTFGHTGFTGNAVWADPDSGILFVFLSNRTYPSMNNNKLINGDYRPRLHSIVYRSLMK
jgi:beta-N-acetylhexosaminidase